MLYRMITKGIPVFLVLVGVGVVTTFDFKTRASEQEGLGFGTYLSEIPTRVGSMFASDAPEGGTIASLMPQPARGWTSRATEDADFFALTGVMPEVLAVDDQQGTDVAGASDDQAAGGNVQGQQIRRLQREMMSFTSSNRMMIVAVTLRPASSDDQTDTLPLPTIQERTNLEIGGRGTEPFATAQGIAFTIAPVKGTERTRYLLGQLGQQMDIEVLSTGNNIQNLAMLEELDIAGLNALLEQPFAEVDPEAGVVPYMPGLPSVTPAVQAAPSAPTAPAAPAAPETPAVTRGVPAGQSANCTLQNGVRRCTVGSN